MKFDSDLKTYFLKPAEFCFVRRPSLIRTVLGSCVTVTMLCRRFGAAAACHPVLPVCRERPTCSLESCRAQYKYVECVIPEMITRFLNMGASLSELEVKLFGGADMFLGSFAAGRMLHIGSQNVEMAGLKLQEFALEPKSVDTGGSRGRKLYFETVSGDVWVKKFRAETAGDDEKKFVQKQLHLQLHDYGPES